MVNIAYDVSHVQDARVGGRSVRATRGRSTRERRSFAYRLYTVEELGQWAPVEWLVPHFLAAGELTCLYGRGATFKSFVALGWACHLANQGFHVVYVVAEGASGIKARIAAWMSHQGVSTLPGLWLLPTSVKLHDPYQVESLVKDIDLQLDGESPALVVVDTLARNFVGGNENSPQDMGLFVEGVERIRRELETAVLVIHHATKTGNAERGTESLRNASFAMFKLDRINQHLTVSVKCERMKEAELPEPVRLKLLRVELPELGSDVSSVVADWPYSGLLGEADEPKHGVSDSRPDRQILALIRDAKDDASPAVIAKQLKVSRRTLARRTKSLLKGGFLATRGTTKDRRYRLTELGREALQ